MKRKKNTRKDIGVCEKCLQQFGYYLIHNGFNESAYAYCDKCGKTCLLNYWHGDIPRKINLKIHQVISTSVTPLLKPCECGGVFKKGASPRCPHCKSILSPVEATKYIEKNASGSKSGWQWQKNWQGLYCIIVENQDVEDNWNESAKTYRRKFWEILF